MITIMGNKRYTYEEQREYEDLKNESKYKGQKPVAPAIGSSSYYRPQPEPERPNEAKYHKKGSYFMCKMCDSYSVHESNDTVCQNVKCPTNQPKTKQPTHCTSCYNKLSYSDNYAAY